MAVDNRINYCNFNLFAKIGKNRGIFYFRHFFKNQNIHLKPKIYSIQPISMFQHPLYIYNLHFIQITTVRLS